MEPRITLSRSLTMEHIGKRELPDFFSTTSLRFFDITGIQRDFLGVDPSQWPDHPTFIEGKTVVDSFRIVNDCAERGVALIKDYIGKSVPPTKDEEQLQFLLKIVKEHREKLPALDNKGEILDTFNE